MEWTMTGHGGRWMGSGEWLRIRRARTGWTVVVSAGEHLDNAVLTADSLLLTHRVKDSKFATHLHIPLLPPRRWPTLPRG